MKSKTKKRGLSKVREGNEIYSAKPTYDLEARTERFAKDVREFVRKLPKTGPNYEDIQQLVRSSGSVGANYIEANEALGRKDFLFHVKISRKEAKESRYWLRILDAGSSDSERQRLIQEAEELTRIFGAIYRKSS